MGQEKTGQDPETKDPKKEEGGSESGTDEIKKLLEENEDLAKLIESKVDQRVTSAVKKRDREWEQKLEQERENAKKKAEEDKLLEEGKLQELLEKRSREAEEARSQLAKYEHMTKVDSLLDKHDVNDKDIRRTLRKMGESMDLKELDEEIVNYTTRFNEAVKKQAEQLVATNPPPKKTVDSLKTVKDVKARITQLQKEGKWDEAMQLQFSLSDTQSKAIGSVEAEQVGPNYNPFGGSVTEPIKPSIPSE